MRPGLEFYHWIFASFRSIFVRKYATLALNSTCCYKLRFVIHVKHLTGNILLFKHCLHSVCFLHISVKSYIPTKVLLHCNVKPSTFLVLFFLITLNSTLSWLGLLMLSRVPVSTMTFDYEGPLWDWGCDFKL